MQARDTVSGFHCLVLTLMSSLKYKRLVLHQFPGREEGEGGGGEGTSSCSSAEEEANKILVSPP